MDISNTSSFNRPAHPEIPTDEDLVLLASFLRALEDGDVSFENEPWHDTSFGMITDEVGPEEHICEYLARPNIPVSISAFNRIPKTLNQEFEFDKFIVINAVAQAISKREFRISINISSRHAGEGGNLTGFHNALREKFGSDFSPSSIIFELLEGDDANNPNADTINDMKVLGYSFALDDVSHQPQDALRLANLGPHVNFIKIDGQTLDDYKNKRLSKGDLYAFMDRITEYAPQAEILIEWVQSAEEIAQLRQDFPQIRFAQGRNLGNRSDFAQAYRATLKPQL